MEITLTINEQDKALLSFLKKFKDEESMKFFLNKAAGLFQQSCTLDGEEGYFEPEVLKENKLKTMSKDELLKLREGYLNNLLMYAQDFHPDQNECGVVHSPTDIYWFVDEGANLGYITIYANYIKAIDEVLNNCAIIK